MLSVAAIKAVDGTVYLIACDANPISTDEDGTQHMMILGADHIVTLELNSLRAHAAAILPGLFGPGVTLSSNGRPARFTVVYDPVDYHATEFYITIAGAMENQACTADELAAAVGLAWEPTE